MTQENKELLLQELSARLPYGVKCISGVDNATLLIEGINPNCCGASEVQVTYEKSGINFDTTMSAIKPYLFPLSSMTEEQSKIYHELIHGMFGTNVLINLEELMNFFYKNHLDWKGLIPKGLAKDATRLNIY